MENEKCNKFYDKVYGGWLGKCLGGAAGAPVEGIKRLITDIDYRDVIRPDLPNDDLDLQLLWLEVMEEKGLSATAEDLADAWNRKCWYPFNEYGYFLKNYERGIMPPYSGSFNNHFFAESEGGPIRSEIWGMLFPGKPDKAAEFAQMDGSLDHTGNAIWIEMYYAAIEAEAFNAEDMRKLLLGQKKYLPENSKARECLEDVIKWEQEYTENWTLSWKKLTKKYLHNDFTNAVINLGIVVLALLYGKEDLDKVIRIAFSSGFDTDCTCATAGAIWGILYGSSNIPDSLKSLINDEFAVGINVERKDNSIKQLAEDTCLLAEKLENQNLVNPPVTMKIEYLGKPVLGSVGQCVFEIKVRNHSDKAYSSVMRITEIPEGWRVMPDNIPLTVESGKEQKVEFKAMLLPDTKILRNKNILNVQYGQYEEKFGIAGAQEWTAAGPFFEPLDKKEPDGYPSPHGEGCSLPSPECLVNNAVYLSTNYLNEDELIKSFDKEETQKISSSEDLLPLDKHFTFQGQGCIYLKQTIIADKEETVWAVVGNNDGFRLWINGDICMERDEIRLWTPYNNYELIRLHRGKNEIILKLLRRTETLKFSLGLKMYGGSHFHRTRWCTNLACEI